MSETPRATILVVEDEAQIRELLTRILSMEGYQTLEAASTEEALALLDGGAIDLILLDLHMPGSQDGEDMLFQLRDRGDQVPIVIVSGWVDDEATLRHPDCVHAVLKKPIQSAQLISTVHQALAQ